MTVKGLRKGDFFTKKAIAFPADRQVWVRGDYDRATRRYVCYRFDDVNTTCALRGDTVVFTDFTF